MPATEVRYNVECMNCTQVFTPGIRTPLWWRAKKNADAGRLDAIRITGEECGCVEEPRNPEAPFRVFGYDDGCIDYNIPYNTFTAAVRAFRKRDREGDVVFISGVSHAVEQKLKYG